LLVLDGFFLRSDCRTTDILGWPPPLALDLAKPDCQGDTMTHVVTKPCDGCRYTDCVTVCPVECFYEGETMLYINPDECIDCEACVPECPVEAIFHEDDVPADWKGFIELNAEKWKDCDNITERKKPLCD